jgi:hypothetical protein
MAKNIHHSENSKKSGAQKGGFPLFQLALGAALAAGAGYYVTHKEEVDKEAKKTIIVLAKLFKEKRAEVEKRVKKVWGSVNKDAIATYLDLRGQLLHALEKANLESRGKMLKGQYEKIVGDILSKAKKSGMLTPEIERKLSEVFNMDWQQVSKVLVTLLATGAKKTVAMVKKSGVRGKVKKAVKSVKKTVGKKKVVAKKSAVKAVKRVAKKPARVAKKSMRKVKSAKRVKSARRK